MGTSRSTTAGLGLARPRSAGERSEDRAGSGGVSSRGGNEGERQGVAPVQRVSGSAGAGARAQGTSPCAPHGRRRRRAILTASLEVKTRTKRTMRTKGGVHEGRRG